MKLLGIVVLSFLAACAGDQRGRNDGIQRDEDIQREEEMVEEEEARTGQNLYDDGVFNPYGL